MIKKLLLPLFLLNILVTQSLAQQNDNYLLWSANRKLTAEDFYIKTGQPELSAAFAQFSMEYSIKGYDVFTKNFNKKVKNSFIKSASSIDTTIDITQTIKYEQTLFDLNEIYARQFRKALRENRKKLGKGLAIAEELNEQVVTELAKRRLNYINETKNGTDATKQKEWEVQIEKELNELAKYSYEN